MRIDRESHRISLSIKEAVIRKGVEGDRVRLDIGQVLKGIVEDIKPYGLFVRLPQLGMKVRGLLPMEELKESGKGDVKKRFSKGKEIQVEIVSIDEKGRIGLSQKVIYEREDREDYKRFLEKEDKGGKLGTLGDIFKDLKLK
jgi:ribosomal protein S1